MAEKKVSLSKKILFIVILLAIVVGAVVGAYSLFNSWKYPKLLNAQFTEIVASNGGELFKDNAVVLEDIEIELDDLKVLDFTPSKIVNISPNDVLGGIYIPNGNIKLPIAKGVEAEYAKSAAVTLQKDFSFEQANVVLGSHSTKGKALFTGLQTLSEGDDIYVTDKNKIYYYTVTKKIRSKSGREDFMLPRNSQSLTLITGFDNEKDEQLVIQAKFVTSDTYAQETVGELFDIFGY